MLFLLIIVGLAVAGAMTDNAAFYWIVGIMEVFALLIALFVGIVARKAFNQTKSVFNDDFFRTGRRR